MPIRPATSADLARIAEIEVFNYRLNFYPIFRSDKFYFGELTVPNLMQARADFIPDILVYDDGVVKGFLHYGGDEIRRLYVEPALQGQGIGAALLEYAIREKHVKRLWALEKNTRAIAFYRRHGFCVTDERRLEEDTEEYLVRMARSEPLDITNLEKWHFEMSEGPANYLLGLVLAGQKRATASSLLGYEIEGEPLPQEGALSVITWWDGTPGCVIRTTRVRVIPYRDITFDIAKLEGEDDDLASWQRNHLAFFRAEGAQLGYVFTEDMPVVFEEFEVVKVL